MTPIRIDINEDSELDKTTYVRSVKVFGMEIYRYTVTDVGNKKDCPVGFVSAPDQSKWVDDD